MTGYGTNDVVEQREMPRPVVGPRDVLIEVHAASLNPLDFKIREGKLRLIRRFPLPAILGNDLAGKVVEVGPAVTRFRPGDPVFARVGKDKLGAFAELAAVDEAFCAPKPASLSMEEAAGVPLVALTAWQALHEELGLRAGQKIFVPAGAGGVGGFAIQFAKLAGATVATTASPAGKALVEKLGADVVVDYRSERFEDRLSGYDAVFDTLGGDSLERSFGILRPDGVVCSIAGAPEPGTAEKMGAGLLVKLLFRLASVRPRRLARKAGVTYRYLFMRPDGEQLAAIGKLVDEGRVRVTIDRVFPFAEAKEALAYLETGRAKGKVILAVKGRP